MRGKDLRRIEMAKARKKRRAKVRKTRKTARRKTSRRKKVASKAGSTNRKAQWEAYRNLQKRVDAAWAKLKRDINKKASPKVLIKGKNELLLLLGECNYMARECTRIMSKSKSRR